ncbi:MAG: 16S rRNA (uracil(1498)-N(3))-methyltransferase [Clostridia bacterium]|nr:16S rRNA (uracil(1498)-N(3))-methyltransferase [Clostridia bacterium]
MPRFFVRRDQITDGIVTIKGDDAHHISRSLRMAAGEHVTVCDMQKNEYDCVLEGFSSVVTARIVSESKINSEPPYRVHLFQGLPKGDKLDTVIQKAVECGVYDITPFECERCIVKVKPDAESAKTERRCRIALEAAKQSGRGIVPVVNPTCTFSEMLSRGAECDAFIMCYEGDGTIGLKTALKDLHDCRDIAIVIGPEGGFSLAEAEAARAAGAYMAGLGGRILRTETAAAFALACLVYEFEL